MITIEEEKMNYNFIKYHLRGLPFDAVIHCFDKADDFEFHDHPFDFVSHVLYGGYDEELLRTDGRTDIVSRYEGQSHYVFAQTVHRIVRLHEDQCFTIIRPKAWVQEPSFYKFHIGVIFKRQWNETEFKPLHI